MCQKNIFGNSSHDTNNKGYSSSLLFFVWTWPSDKEGPGFWRLSPCLYIFTWEVLCALMSVVVDWILGGDIFGKPKHFSSELCFVCMVNGIPHGLSTSVNWGVVSSTTRILSDNSPD